MDKFNIAQTEVRNPQKSNERVWGVLDGQRAPAGYPAPGASFVVVNLTYDLAKQSASALNACDALAKAGAA